MSSSIREFHADGWCVRLDLGPQVFGIEVPEQTICWGRDREEEPLLPVPPIAADGPVSAAAPLLLA